MLNRYTLKEMGRIWSEENKFRSWLDVEIAVCEVWNRLGKIPDSALKNIKDKASFSIDRINEIEKEVDHDLIAFTTAVAEKVGEDSRFIHMGMTSYDVEDTALSLRLRESADIIIKDIEALISAIKKRASEHKASVMIGRTHGVHAEPITFAFKMCVWIAELERDIERMKNAKKTVSAGKMSGAVGTYANIDPEVEKMVCERLGLESAKASTQILQRDRFAEYMTTIAVIAGGLEQFATELRNMTRTELLEVEEPFKKGQKGSSAMPHKKNPIVCERITGLARVIRANSMVALENIALWHERDLSNSGAERIVIPDSNILTDYILQKFSYIMENLVIHPDNMLKNIGRSFGTVFSQRLLLKLIDKGLTRENAYKIVQTCAMKARETESEMKSIVKSDKDITKQLSSAEIDDAFDINYYTRNLDKVYKRFGI